MIRRPTRYTRTATLCPYWTLVRSAQQSRDIIPNTCIGIAIRIVDRYPVTIGKSDGGEPAIQPFHLARGQFAAGVGPDVKHIVGAADRSEEHTSELQPLMRSSYPVFCLEKIRKKTKTRKA